MMTQDGRYIDAFEKVAMVRQVLHQADELLTGIYTDHISKAEDLWEEGAAKTLGELAGELERVRGALDEWIQRHIESLLSS